MSVDYWEDRISDTEHAVCVAAIDVFRNSNKSRDAQHQLYEVLTNNGVMGEEADEIVNLEVQAS